MMALLVLFLLPLALWGQTTPSTPINLQSLPVVTVGIGPSWTRGEAQKYAGNVTVAVHISGNWYSWSNIATPIRSHATGPVTSAVSTGGAWIIAQSSRFSLLTIMQLGLQSQPAQSYSADISGSLGVSYRIFGGNQLLVYAQAVNLPNVSGLVFQPGFRFMRGF